MKYVYVLTSTPKDLYYEQALMSLYSLRLYMKEAEVIVLVDDKTMETLTEENKRSALKKYASRIIAIPFDEKITNIERSRLIKTAIPQYIDGSFLYIDCDTIIAGDLSSIEKEPFETAGVLDGHVMLQDHIHQKAFIARDKKLGFHGTRAAGCNINGGVILANEGEATKALFKAWNEAWKFSAYKKGDFHDQSALNEANYRTGMKMGHLDGIWNCQPSHGGLAFLKDAKIIHYYSSEFSGKNYVPYYKLADKNLQTRIKESGELPDDVIAMIAEPKFQFNPVHIINDSRIVSIMQSPLVFTLADIKKGLPFLFNFMEGVAAFIRKCGKLVAGKR